MFDEIDMKRTCNVCYWRGAIAGVLGTLILCGLVGYYIT